MAKEDLETLMAGGTIEKPVHEEITYGDIHQSQDNLWNFLFFTGYLKKISERKDESGETLYPDHGDSEYRDQDDLQKFHYLLV